VQNSVPPRMPSAFRVSIQRARLSSQLRWKPRVVALSPLPWSMRTLCLRRSAPAGLRATISLTLRPERCSGAIRALFLIPLADLAEQRR
jgi:hypothetical protein